MFIQYVVCFSVMSIKNQRVTRYHNSLFGNMLKMNMLTQMQEQLTI